MARRFDGERLVVATHNKGKLEEISALLEPFSVDVVSAGQLGLTEPAETETTFVGNARIKAHFAAKASGCPRWRMTRVSRLTGWAGRRGSIPPIGRRRRRGGIS